MKAKNLLGVLFLALISLLSGCATFESGLPTVSKNEFLSWSDEKQAAYPGDLKSVEKRLKIKDDGEYAVGLPVTYGSGTTKHTQQWVKLPGKYDAVAVYPGHNPDGLSGAVHEGMFLALANKQGEIEYQDGPNGVGVPIYLLKNVAATEDFVAAMLKAGISGFGNGGLSTILNKTLPACDNCGSNSGVVNFVSSSSGSLANAQAATTSNAGVNTGGGWLK